MHSAEEQEALERRGVCPEDLEAIIRRQKTRILELERTNQLLLRLLAESREAEMLMRERVRERQGLTGVDN